MESVVVMPVLADGMIEGTLVRWLVSNGALVQVGEELAEIETDKATVIYAAEASGKLRQLIAPGVTVPVETPIAELSNADEPVEAEHASLSEGRADVRVRQSTAAQAPRSPTPRPPATRSDRLRASPVARRLAATHAIDVAALTGTGPRGRIVRADVLLAIDRLGLYDAPPNVPGQPLAGALDEREHAGPQSLPATRSQQTIARKMSQAKAEAPEFHVMARSDMTECVALRAQLRLAGIEDPLPSINDLIVKAVAVALQAHPRANARYVNEALELRKEVNIGIAVAVDDELVVPVISSAATKRLQTVAREARELTGRARAGRLTPADVAGGTFTISNLGMLGVESFEAILNPPQVAILAVGSMVDTVVPADNGVAVRPLMSLTLVCDHRALYGAHAAALLREIRINLENPVRLLV